MKTPLIIIFLVIIAITSYAQSPDKTMLVFNHEDYLQKSKKQKTAAWFLLGGGVGLVIIGGAIALNNLQDDPIREAFTISGGDVIWVIGGLAMLGSIPLFISASNNKRKAFIKDKFR